MAGGQVGLAVGCRLPVVGCRLYVCYHLVMNYTDLQCCFPAMVGRTLGTETQVEQSMYEVSAPGPVSTYSHDMTVQSTLLTQMSKVKGGVTQTFFYPPAARIVKKINIFLHHHSFIL